MLSNAKPRSICDTSAFLRVAFSHEEVRRFLLVHFLAGRRRNETTKLEWPGRRGSQKRTGRGPRV
jgi:hypothetical protein